MKKLTILLLALLALAGPAHGAVRHDRFPLHPGSAGPNVAAVQWLISGHRPNVFTKVKPTLKKRGYTRGVYGARTKAAVRSYEYRLGFPAKGQCGARAAAYSYTATRELYLLLVGRHARPRCWVAVAAERVKGAVIPGATPAALAIQRLEVSQLGVHEIPDGSNRGPRISYAADGVGPYQASTGAYGAAWCASFADWALRKITGDGFGSANDAFVPTVAAYAQAHNWLLAKPRVGTFVIFLSNDLQLVNAFHIGYVVKVTATGVQTIEGNEGNAVREVWRPYATNHMLYIGKPGVA